MGNPGSKQKPPAEDKSINAKKIILNEEHNNYSALFNIDGRNDHFGELSDGGFPHFTVWPIFGAVVATLLLIYCVKKKETASTYLRQRKRPRK